MVLFSIENLSVEEIATLRQSLNVIDIKGSSAQFIAHLQIKLDKELKKSSTSKSSIIQNHIYYNILNAFPGELF